MKIKIIALLSLSIFLLTSTVFDPVVNAIEERKVLTRNYVGLGAEVYAPYQCYPGENITVRVRVEALEGVKNASITLFIWGSKSEGYSPWGTSFTVLDIEDFPKGTVQDNEYEVEIPLDIDPGLTYGILFLDWSVYIQSSWEDQWDKASFRLTYVNNEDYENLQTTYNDLLTTYNNLQDKYNSTLNDIQNTRNDLQNTRTLTYVLLTTTIMLAISTTYFAKRKPKVRPA